MFSRQRKAVYSTLVLLVLITLAASGNDDNLILPEDSRPTRSSEEVQDHQVSKRPILIVLSFDGFRHDYFSKVDTPNLDRVKAHGISTPFMKPQFPTKTFPNHHSLSTGLHPESHGIVDNTFFDPMYNQILGVGNETAYVYNTDVVPLWILNEWAGGVSGAMMWPGTLFGYGRNKTTPTYLVDYNSSVPFEIRVDTCVSWITHDTNPANVIFAYFEEPDSHAHAYGPDSPEVLGLIQDMDNLVGYLMGKLERLGILDKVNLVFLSDHGFTPVTRRNIINVSDIVDSSTYQFSGGSPIYSVFPTEGQDVDSLFAQFRTASHLHNFTVYKTDSIKTEKPDWFYAQSRRIGPIVLLADEGFVFEDFLDKVNYYKTKYNITDLNHTYGMHGYDNGLPSMGAFFRAIGPAFDTGVELSPFYNIDLFPMFCHLLQIHTPPNNGSLRTVFKALAHAHTQEPQSTNTVAWIAGGGVLIGFGILMVITASIMRGRWTKRRAVVTHTPDGYRVQSDRFSGMLDENLNTPLNSVLSPESRGLLCLSDDSGEGDNDQVV